MKYSMHYNKVVTTLIFISILCSSASSQVIEPQASKKLRYGYNIAPNLSVIQPSSDLPANTTTFNTLNFRVGFRADYSFNKWFSISPEINWSFNEGGYRFADSSQLDYQLMPMSFDFMTHLKFKKSSDDLSPYCIIGPNVRVPVLRESVKLPYTTSSDVALSIGLGIEKRFMYFTFSPEVRYTAGFMNISNHPLVPTAQYNNVSLALNFTL